MPFSYLTDVFEYRLLTKFDRNAPHMIGTAGNEMWATENGVRPVKGRPAALSNSRAIGKRFVFIRGCAHLELLLRGDSDLQRGAEASGYHF
jgi:hypothetical protein